VATTKGVSPIRAGRFSPPGSQNKPCLEENEKGTERKKRGKKGKKENESLR
jgi:hypothetical protein